MISTRSTGFDIGVCLGLKLGPLGYARCPVELGAGPKRHGPEEIIGKLREAEIVLAQGGTTGNAWLGEEFWCLSHAAANAYHP